MCVFQRLVLCAAIAVAIAGPSANGERSARWYVNNGRVDDNVAFAKAHPGALTGWYGCCNLLSVNESGHVAVRSNLTASTVPLKAALAPNRTLTFHAVFSVAEPAIHSGAALLSVPDLVRVAKAGGVDGLLCDYEPADNYTHAHVQAYANFLSALTEQSHAAGIEVGLDVAGWGILDPMKFKALSALKVDLFTSMTPTYSGRNVSLDQSFAAGLVQAVGANRAAIGIGSMPAAGAESACKNMPDYAWTKSSFDGFAAWLRTDAGVLDLDVWRCDIDNYGKTAPWFVDAVASFLGLSASA